MYCRNCGAEVPDKAVHCPNCGSLLRTADNSMYEQADRVRITGNAMPDNSIQAAGKAQQKKSDSLLKSILYPLLSLGCLKLFGALECCLGFLTMFLTEKALEKKYPGEKWTGFVSAAAGLAVAFMTAILFGILLSTLSD